MNESGPRRRRGLDAAVAAALAKIVSAAIISGAAA